MNTGTSNSSGHTSLLLSNATFGIKAADIAAILVVIALPWSTTLVAIFVVAWLIVLVPAIKISEFLDLFKQPICALPVAFFALAVIGTLWSEAPWYDRWYAIGPMAKFLALPLLIYHFQRSSRSMWVLVAFLASCVVLMCMSWLVAFEPSLALKTNAEYGVPVKNYIDQSQEFSLCAVAAAWPILQNIRERRYWTVVVYSVIVAVFLVNMMYVTVSRTAIVTMPIMLLAFAALHLHRRGFIAVALVAGAVSAVLWFAAPNLRIRTLATISEYEQYHDTNAPSSVGLRIEFWRKSLEFFAEAPVIGHGSGSTRMLFKEAALGQTGASAEIINNPHNQTLNIAVQWGMVGIIILYAMWIFHFLMFREGGFYAWIGLLVVIQNIVGSAFNSHLFDFTEGWIYVLGVGVLGGAVQRNAICWFSVGRTTTAFSLKESESNPAARRHKSRDDK